IWHRLSADGQVLSEAWHVIELVANTPARFVAWLDAQIDQGFGADSRTNRPQVQLRHRPIAGLPHARARATILDADVVILRAGAEALEVGLHRLSRLQFLQIYERLASHVSKTIESTGRVRLERESHDEAGTCGLPIQHAAVVLV